MSDVWRIKLIIKGFGITNLNVDDILGVLKKYFWEGFLLFLLFLRIWYIKIYYILFILLNGYIYEFNGKF